MSRNPFDVSLPNKTLTSNGKLDKHILTIILIRQSSLLREEEELEFFELIVAFHCPTNNSENP